MNINIFFTIITYTGILITCLFLLFILTAFGVIVFDLVLPLVDPESKFSLTNTISQMLPFTLSR